MLTVHKYTISQGNFKVRLPLGAKIISVHTQDNVICIWAEVETLASTTEERSFEVFGTGHRMPETQYGQHRTFLGTVFFPELVFHVYELITEEK